MDARESFGVLVEYLTQKVPVAELPVVDAIFVHGCHFPALPRHAAELFRLGRAPYVLVTGGVGPASHLPSGYRSEAQYYEEILRSEGVPACRIFIEEDSTNTLENVLCGIILAEKAKISLRQIIAVATPPLLRRSIATFKKQRPHTVVFGSAPEISADDMIRMGFVPRICGEIDRLIEYADKGDIAPTEIPPHIMDAYYAVKRSL